MDSLLIATTLQKVMSTQNIEIKYKASRTYTAKYLQIKTLTIEKKLTR